MATHHPIGIQLAGLDEVKDIFAKASRVIAEQTVEINRLRAEVERLDGELCAMRRAAQGGAE